MNATEFLAKVRGTPLSDSLADLVPFARQRGDTDLSRWAMLELAGYVAGNPVIRDDDVVPEYRSVRVEYFAETGQHMVFTPELDFVCYDRLRESAAQLEQLSHSDGWAHFSNASTFDMIGSNLGVRPAMMRISVDAIRFVISSIRTEMQRRVALLEEGPMASERTSKKTTPERSMPSVSPEQGIALIQKQISKGETLSVETFVTDDGWRSFQHLTRDILKRAFGTPSEHLDGFQQAGWIGAYPMGADERWHERARRSHLQAEITFLRTLIDVLELEIAHPSPPSRLTGSDTISSQNTQRIINNFHGNVGSIQHGAQSVAHIDQRTKIDVDGVLELLERLRTGVEREVSAEEIIEVREVIDGIEKEIVAPRGSLAKAKALARGLTPVLHGAAGNVIAEILKALATS